MVTEKSNEFVGHYFIQLGKLLSGKPLQLRNIRSRSEIRHHSPASVPSLPVPGPVDARSGNNGPPVDDGRSEADSIGFRKEWL